MMALTSILNVVGTLFPIIFPKQEFRPKRLVAVVVCTAVVVVTISLLGIEQTGQVLEFTNDLVELTEE